ncbi:MAG: hypothetical protein M3198_06075 [Actinomycetota bacterium]|nr:hypothetical protein [Actinomycetota bacterium]
MDSIDAARAEVTASLLGHHGIVGVGRTEDMLVFFVADRARASPVLDQWVREHDVPIEVKDLSGFRPAGQS